MTTDIFATEGQCEYCGIMMDSPFNRIKRYHRDDNIPICPNCIQSLYLRGDIALNEYSRWAFKEDIEGNK